MIEKKQDHVSDSPNRSIEQLWNGQSPNEDARSNSVDDEKDKSLDINKFDN